MQQINKPYEGFFITIEGGEGSGKSTLATRLYETLTEKGYSVVKTREPGGSPLAEHLRDIVLNPNTTFPIAEKSELLLFLTARIQHLEEVILPALREGKMVICERFNDSTISYQGCARHLGTQFVEQLCRLVCEGVEPNLTFLLDITPEEGLARLDHTSLDRIEKEEAQFHHEVRQGFLHLADKYPNRIIILDATSAPTEIASQAIEALEPRLATQ